MTDSLISSVVTVLLAVTAVGFIAVLVSKNANTAGVLTAGGSAFSQALGTAESPITGSGFGFGSGSASI